MNIADIIFTGLGLSMDAAAVSAANGLAEPRMKKRKAIFIALAFGLAQGIMPIAGYYLGSVFAGGVATFAPYLAFALLALIGGKMFYEGVRELKTKKSEKAPADENGKAQAGEVIAASSAKAGEEAAGPAKKPLSVASLLLQAVATSIDALAVGITMAALKALGELKVNVFAASGIIAAITFAVCVVSVFFGKKFGALLSGKAELVGGLILIAIGIKILIEGLI